ncbi:MAG: hypothetical protein GY786_24635 [Proteobacteria bacterium]|nr:hypothetical protein [Pseudomonadota bacterium]
MIHDAASVAKTVAQNKKIEFVYQIPQKVSPLMGDEALITQAVLNVLDNAVKFSPTGSIIQLRLVEKELELVLEVSDEGPGIKDEEKLQVFE